MGEYDPIGHIAGVRDMDDTTMRMLASENAIRLLDIKV
jgi:hypothetical protein